MKRILTLIAGLALMATSGLFAQGNTCDEFTVTGVGPNGAPIFTPEFTPIVEMEAAYIPSCDTKNISYDVFFAFVAPASGEIRITEDLSTGSGDFEVAIWSGSCDVPVEVFCNNSTFDEIYQVTGLDGNQTYILQVFADNAQETGRIGLENGVAPSSGCNNQANEAICVSESGETFTEEETSACPWQVSPFGLVPGGVPGANGPNPPGNGFDPVGWGAATDRGLWYKFTGAGCALNSGEANICIESPAPGVSGFAVYDADFNPVIAGGGANTPGAFFFNRTYCQQVEVACGSTYYVFAGTGSFDPAPINQPEFTLSFNGEILPPIPELDVSCIQNLQVSLGNDGTYELDCSALRSDTVTYEECDVTIVSVDGDTGDNAVGSNVVNCTHVGKEVYAMVTVGETALVCSPTNGCPAPELVTNSCWVELTVEDKIAPRLACPQPTTFDCNEDSEPGVVQTRRFEITPNGAIGPDAGNVTNFFQNVPDYGNVAIQGVNVYLDFDYDNIVDWFAAGAVTLTSPEGTTYDMYPIAINPNCQLLFGVDKADHGFDDASAIPFAFCQDINSQNDILPIGASLDATFAGEDPEGQWSWAFTDQFDAQGGTVNRLVIELELANTVDLPIVQENCTFDLTFEDVVDNRNNCGVGTIIREFTATDASGNTGTCRQTLNFGSIDPPSIIFPGDYEADCFVDPISLTPDVTGEVRISGNDDCVQYAIGSDDLFLDDCAPYGYKIRRTWTVLDWCDPQFEETQDQIIKIVDEEAPVISCPADFTVSLRHNDCFTNVSLPRATATDNCDFNVDITRELLDPNDNVIPTAGVPPGAYIARYIAEDACGNTDTCFVHIRVIDPVAPVVVTFQNLVVSLTAGGWAYLCADQVDDGSNDNCTGVGVYIKKEGDDNWKYYDNFVRQNNCVRFQCRDLGENNVKVRVYDDANGDGFFGPNVDNTGDNRVDETDFVGAPDNYNEAWATVLVEDKLPPVLVCPPDISLNCLTDFDDLEITGEAEADLNCDREDPTYTDVVPHGYCPDSDIIRTWRVEKRLPGYDGVEGTADDLVWVRSCEQVITITDDTPVTIEKLPLDITIDCTGGAVGTDPDDLTKYNFFDDYLNTPQNPGDDSLVVFDNPVLDYDCEHIGINYEDQPFGLCLPGSYKIRRNWTVIDWCDDDFEITYTNVILVDDKEPPILTVNNPGTVLITNNDPQCRMFADITASAVDLCSNVTITNNSPYGPGTFDASGVYPKGTYTITFTAVDGCGNVATEEITVNVVDGKAPTAICDYGISAGLKASCDLVLTPDKINGGSSDNCTDEANLGYELARVDANGDLVDRAEDLTFTCDDVGNQRIALIVIDAAGNEAVCETVVQIQVGSCPDPDCDDNPTPPTLSVTGTISKENGDQVNGVEILLDGATVNQANGGFGMLIDKDQTGMAYGVVEALKEDVADNGVSTIDLVTIRRAILQVSALSDYQNIAADINNSQGVTTFDMVEIRKAILKQIDEFTKVPSWRFVPGDHTFAGDTWATPVPFVYEVETSADEMEINFVAIKMGDVTGDADVNSSRSYGTFDIEVADAVMNRGEEVEVTMTSDQLSEVLGYQFTLGFDASSVELVDIAGDVEDYNFNLDRVSQGMIAVSKVSEEVSGEELFTLTFRALENASISEVLSINSEITRAEAYDAGSSRLDVELSFVNDAADYALYQNVPNPFNNRTTIGFNMAEAGQATITVLDITGKVVYSTTLNADKGRNDVTVDRGQLNSNGIMYYQLEAGDFVATKKMIMIK